MCIKYYYFISLPTPLSHTTTTPFLSYHRAPKKTTLLWFCLQLHLLKNNSTVHERTEQVAVVIINNHHSTIQKKLQRMSNFANLLGKLENSANLAVKTSRKRPQPSKNDGDSCDRTDTARRSQIKKLKEDNVASFVPRDVNQLSIEISFLGIGAQKSGTTWLHKILSAHQNLSLPK